MLPQCSTSSRQPPGCGRLTLPRLAHTPRRTSEPTPEDSIEPGRLSFRPFPLAYTRPLRARVGLCGIVRIWALPTPDRTGFPFVSKPNVDPGKWHMLRPLNRPGSTCRAAKAAGVGRRRRKVHDYLKKDREFTAKGGHPVIRLPATLKWKRCAGPWKVGGCRCIAGGRSPGTLPENAARCRCLPSGTCDGGLDAILRMPSAAPACRTFGKGAAVGRNAVHWNDAPRRARPDTMGGWTAVCQTCFASGELRPSRLRDPAGRRGRARYPVPSAQFNGRDALRFDDSPVSCPAWRRTPPCRPRYQTRRRLPRGPSRGSCRPRSCRPRGSRR